MSLQCCPSLSETNPLPFTSSITDTLSLPLLFLQYPPYNTAVCLITHSVTDWEWLRVGNCNAGATHLFSPPLFIIWSALLSGRQRDTVLSAPLWQRDLSPYQSSICSLYMSLPCVCLCVCARGGAASGRFPVNTDLREGTINDFIIGDKARIEQEVSEGLWCLGEEVTLGAGVPKILCTVFKTPKQETDPL